MAQTPTDPLADVAAGAEDACGAVEAALRAYLPSYLPSDLPVPFRWEQLPTADAMRSEDVPAVAITSPGLAETPERSDRGRTYSATWTVWVTVWVRGEDGTYASTTSATRRYAKAVRTAVLAYAQANGLPWTWMAEEYDAMAVPNMAATMQAGLIQFTVPINAAVDLAALPDALPGSDGLWPRVQHTYVTVKPRE